MNKPAKVAGVAAAGCAAIMLAGAATRADKPSRAHCRAGRDSRRVSLDSPRASYGARRQPIAAQLAEQANRVTLYEVSGGGRNERAP